MTRAAERPATMKSDQEEPEQNQDEIWQEQVEGETPDSSTTQALNLAHRVTEKFPDLVTRYKSYAGPAAIVSSALMALAGVAVARRLRRGQNAEEILDQITSEEIERAASVSSRQNRVWRMVKRIALRRYGSGDASPGDASSAD
ncbi:MAG: hypothetical protein IIB22_08885 [Chloroflexi bacterium]|nr:hypothetical protein [Chloroflexota bacterium]MCH8161182.1 hypothetical protein [Chloroflexota bacterium]